MAQIINKTVIYARIFLPFIVFLAWPGLVQSQTVPQPDRERLLNGLTILYANRPGDPQVLLKLRIHSGAAFDLSGKAGTMALLAAAMFPESTTGEYVSQELGGRLEVTTTYDAIDIAISGKATELERMIELRRNALVNLNLSAENVATLREARIKELAEKQSSTTAAANRAIALRLFGTYPYARPPEGTVETVAKIERADLMLARDRFLNADNAALAVIGGVDKARLMRAARQILGPWQKSERIVPATFRQPGPVNSHVFVIDQAGMASNAEIRLAVRGLARSDPDADAASVLAAITRKRWTAAAPELSAVSVQHEAHGLQGMFVLGASVSLGSAAKAIGTAKEVMKALAESGPTQQEVSEAALPSLFVSHRSSPAESLADTWLDAETYKIPLSTLPADANRISPADIKRVAAKLFGDPAREAIVVLGNANELKSQFGEQAEVPAPATKPSGILALPSKKP
jgi:zinc protease